MDNVEDPSITAAKAYLEDNDNHLTHMTDGDFQVDTHDTAIDSHIVSHLPNVDQAHIDTDVYDVVTVTKDLTMGDGAIIQKVVKLEVDKDNNVKNVLESK